MNRNEFLAGLERQLSQLDPAERQKQLDYYAELLSDMTEDGMSEEEAAAKIGSPESVAAEIFAEMPLPALVRSRVRPRSGWNALSIVLLVLGSPIWLSLLLALAAVVIAVYAVIWAVILSLFAAVAAIAAAGVGAVLLGVTELDSGVPRALMFLGAGLVCAALSIPAFLGALWCAKALVRLTAVIFRGIKSLFVRRERIS